MTKKSKIQIAVCLLIVLGIAAGCAQPSSTPSPSPEQAVPETVPEPTKDKIVVGQATSLSGPLASGVAVSNGPVYEMWVKEINDQGGIYVEEYGKKLPIEYIKYDDKSDMGTMTRLLEKLILEDQVDFLLPPWGTAFLYAAAPIANKHGYILIGGPGGAAKLKEIISGLPYFFSVYNFAETQIPALGDILEELGVKSVGIIFIGDLHGVEYSGAAVPEFELRGIEVKMIKSYSPGIQDMSPMLKEAKMLDVDAFIGFTYPEETMLITTQAMELDINFDVFHLSVGPCFGFYKDAFGAEVVEGVMGPASYNKKSSPGAAEFIEKYIAFTGQEPTYWGGADVYASLQHLQQAIEEAGTLDQARIRELLATKTYETCVGPFSYEGGLFKGHLGEMGQWQSGIFEIIEPGENRTAPPIIKPEWPK